jgi:hypothetical protein
MEANQVNYHDAGARLAISRCILRATSLADCLFSLSIVLFLFFPLSLSSSILVN